MTTYKMLNLREVIEALRNLPEGSEVEGLDGDLHSDRGFYERSATAPAPGRRQLAFDLAMKLEEQIGKPTVGWKGGDFTVSEDLPVHVGEYGDTGPSILGFEVDQAGVWRPLLLAESYCW